MSISTIYVVGVIKNFIEVEMELDEPKIKAKGTCQCVWAKGMIGAFPCFLKLSDAEAYAGPLAHDKIMEFEADFPDHA